MNSDYPEVIAFKNMITTANISGGTNYAVYDINATLPITFPCIIIDSDTEINVNDFTNDGEIICGFYDQYNSQIPHQQQVLMLQSKIRNFVKQLKYLDRSTTGFMIDPRYRITPGARLNSNASNMSSTGLVYSTFSVSWGFRE